MCGNLYEYIRSLLTPSPSEVRGALLLFAIALSGVGYAIYKGRKPSAMRYRTYTAEKVKEAPPSPPVDTGYFLYERRLYVRRRPRPHAVNVNRAGVSELVSLPGVGPVLARRIVEYRGKYGPFKRPEDLLEVKGIGPKKLKKMRPYLRF